MESETKVSHLEVPLYLFLTLFPDDDETKRITYCGEEITVETKIVGWGASCFICPKIWDIANYPMIYKLKSK